jgi:hypothetical protein
MTTRLRRCVRVSQKPPSQEAGGPRPRPLTAASCETPHACSTPPQSPEVGQPLTCQSKSRSLSWGVSLFRRCRNGVPSAPSCRCKIRFPLNSGRAAVAKCPLSIDEGDERAAPSLSAPSDESRRGEVGRSFLSLSAVGLTGLRFPARRLSPILNDDAVQVGRERPGMPPWGGVQPFDNRILNGRYPPN